MIQLDDHQIADGIRLACQVFPKSDLTVRIVARAVKSVWRPFTPFEVKEIPEGPYQLPRLPKRFPKDIIRPYGMAVDLGTTHLSISILELYSGYRLCGRTGPNPQITYGADIMTRLERAVESPVQAGLMKQMALEAVENGLWDMATRDGIDIHRIATGFLVGNTAMLALLMGIHYERLLQSAYGSERIDCIPEADSSSLAPLWGLHEAAQMNIIPPLAGFVGSDLTAGVLSVGLMESHGPALFVDFGTNSEMALWDGRVLWVTSAAGGPAFEGCGISSGMPAEPGAIYRIDIHTDPFHVKVIDDAEPMGICGSGLVDLIAGLLKRGTLSEIGRLDEKIPGDGVAIADGSPALRLLKRDVDIFQRAKAAIGTGVRTLCLRAGIRLRDLARICVAGSLGRFLDVDNAFQVGLLPLIEKNRVELCGNTALAGCEMALLNGDFVPRLDGLLKKTKFINLSECLDFNDLYMENLYLKPFVDGENP